MEMEGGCWPTTPTTSTTTATIGTGSSSSSSSSKEMKRKSTSNTTSSSAAAGGARVYRGVWMRKWGKWVAEIHVPKKKTRIWLGSYSTPVAAARSYDAAAYLISGRSAKLNFPEETAMEMVDMAASAGAGRLSSDSIKKKAAEVGTRIDALQTGLASCNNQRRQQPPPPPPQQQRPDLNQHPTPDSLDDL